MHNRQDITETNLKPALLEGKEKSDGHCCYPAVQTEDKRKEQKSWKNDPVSEQSFYDVSCFLVSAVSAQTAFLEAQAATFTRHRTRLAVVREQKEKARLDMLGEYRPELTGHTVSGPTCLLICFDIFGGVFCDLSPHE